MEAIAAAQMEGEVPSMSGSHGNLSHRSHHKIVGSELRVVVTTGFSAILLALHVKANCFVFQRSRFIDDTSSQCHHVETNRAKYIENADTQHICDHILKTI